MRTLAVVSRKGGTLKTTTCANLGAALAARGRRVLLVDADPQGNLGQTFGIEAEGDADLAAGLLDSAGELAPAPWVSPDAIRSVRDRLDLVPTSRRLADVDAKGRAAAEVLRAAFSLLPDRWDVVLLDTPPGLGGLAISALVAADAFIVTTTPDPFAMRAVRDVLEEVEELRANAALRANPELLGILIARIQVGTRMGQAAEEALRRDHGKTVFRAMVRHSVLAAESAAHHLPVLDFAASSPVALDYAAFAGEVDKRISRRT